MSDYNELVNELRSKHIEDRYKRMTLDAATAIEELEAQAKDKDYLIQQQTEEIQRLQRDVKKQQEKMIELAGKLPKKGKWTARYDPDDKPFFQKKYVCSSCGSWNTYGMPDYCPHCGAKNGT